MKKIELVERYNYLQRTLETSYLEADDRRTINEELKTIVDSIKQIDEGSCGSKKKSLGTNYTTSPHADEPKKVSSLKSAKTGGKSAKEFKKNLKVLRDALEKAKASKDKKKIKKAQKEYDDYKMSLSSGITGAKSPTPPTHGGGIRG